MNVYIVFGTTGEYSDRSEWPVKAYLDEVRAQEHVEAASADAREFMATSHGEHYSVWGMTKEELAERFPHDPNFSCDYTGTKYYLETVELDERDLKALLKAGL